MKLNEFVNKHINTKVDFDGVFGAQCVDLFRQYCKDVLQIPHTGSVDGAKDLFLNYDKLPLEQKYFNKISMNCVPFPEDIIIWNKTEKNKYGHVAILISYLGNNEILVFEQDGIKQNGARLEIRKMDNMLGLLRFKGGK